MPPEAQHTPNFWKLSFSNILVELISCRRLHPFGCSNLSEASFPLLVNSGNAAFLLAPASMMSHNISTAFAWGCLMSFEIPRSRGVRFTTERMAEASKPNACAKVGALTVWGPSGTARLLQAAPAPLAILQLGPQFKENILVQ